MGLRRIASEVTLREYKQRLLRVLVHIQRHLDDSLELEEVAAVACLSPYHFHRVFTGMIGESLMGHIRRLRLERAAVRLKLSRLPVTEIALQAGYESHEAFTRAFKVSYGVAPARFRSTRSPIPTGTVPSGVHFSANEPPKNFKARRSRIDHMNVQIKSLPPSRVAFTRHVGPYDKVGETWDKLLVFLGKEALIGGDALFIGICHDDPEVTPPDKLRYDACVTVDDAFKPVGDVGVQTVPGGDYAVTTHFGPYSQLAATYAKLFGQWLPRSGRQLRSTPCFEVYLNSPENTEPNELLTDIHMPLQPAGSIKP